LKTFFFTVIFIFTIHFFAAAQQHTIIVDANGKGQYRTLQAALNAISSNDTAHTIIFLKKGIYNEKIIVDATKNNITLIGDDKANTIITFNNHAGTILQNGDTLNTWTCASVTVYGNNFNAQHIAFKNNAGFTAGQAVAVRVEGTRASFNDCNFIGFQDVLFLSGSGAKHYFNHCYIEGTTDFIFGSSTAVFTNCTLHSKKNSHVTAASTNSIIPFGFVFINCKLTADSNVNKVSLGRPWSPTASVTYIECELGAHIIPDGWNNWKNVNNELTARYAEYKNIGPGAAITNRVSWSKQLTNEEVKKFTKENILGTWQPYLNNY
jgi:pectinesterase